MFLPLRFAARRISRSALVWSFSATATRAAAGLLILPLVARVIPSEHLGLWYIFVSFQGIVTLFDVGFNPAVTRAAGYIWAGARHLTGLGIDPSARPDEHEEPNYRLLSELIATMRAYYLAFAAVAGLVMFFAGGYWIIEKTQGLPQASSLRFAYAVFSCGVILNAMGDLWPALLAGINAVRESEKLLFGSILINYSIVAIGILSGLGLWALVLGTLCSGLFLRISGRYTLLRILGARFDRTQRATLALVKTLWPMAWRTGTVTVGTFLVLSANTLICSAFLSLETTASYGLTLNLINIITYVSIIITQIKVPLVNQLRLRGENSRIIDLWIERTRLSVFVYCLGAIFLVVLGNPLLHLIDARTELLPPAQLAVFLLILGLIMHHILYAFLVVSENRNPFVIPALASGAATLVLSLLLTPHFGIWGMLIAQGSVQLSFNNWWTVWRAIRGLEISGAEYWRRYFRKPIGIS